MLAFSRHWHSEHPDLGGRIAASLGLFRGQAAPFVRADGAIFASCAHRIMPGQRRWTVPRAPSGRAVLLSGWIDNAAELSQALGVDERDIGRLYGAAFDRWGDDADLHVIGDYCALVDDAEARTVRMSRSPWRAPPLHYYCDQEKVVAASVPRALHAAGVPAELEQRKIIDNHFLDLTADRGWYKGCHEVALAASVHVTPGERKPRVYYDMLAKRETRLPALSDYVEAADALLREACRVTLGNAQAPGMFLSGGLDSSNVAARLLDCLPRTRTLKSFTFRPLEDFEDPHSYGLFGDDGPAVERFAAMHPRIEPFYSRNEGCDFDSHFEKMFLATGVAPASLPNMYLYHSLCAQAKSGGCDLLLWADFGNIAFSSTASHAYWEYLRAGKWRQWWRAVSAKARYGSRPLFDGVASVLGPLLPDRLWMLQRRLRGKSYGIANDAIGALRPEVIEELGLRDHARKAGVLYLRNHVRSRAEDVALFFAKGDCNFSDTMQGFEQIYGIDHRDVTAYRPFLEFCLGMPTDVFMHDGQNRWLARELGRGLMPEEQRLDQRQGMHSGDWHERMTPRLAELRQEVEEASRIPELDAIIDFQQVLAAFDDWPERGSYDDAALFRYLMAPSRAIMTKRFDDFVSGRNRS